MTGDTFQRAGDLAQAQLLGMSMWSSMSLPGLSSPGVCSCCPYSKNKNSGMMSAVQGVIMHRLGLISFMDSLPEYVVNESRNYKHQISSMPCCIGKRL